MWLKTSCAFKTSRAVMYVLRRQPLPRQPGESLFRLLVLLQFQSLVVCSVGPFEIFDATQLIPPGSPLRHKMGGTEVGSLLAANVGATSMLPSIAASTPIAIMNAGRCISGDLTWFPLAGHSHRPRTFGFNGYRDAVRGPGGKRKAALTLANCGARLRRLNGSFYWRRGDN
jgi:hypothetical protein